MMMKNSKSTLRIILALGLLTACGTDDTNFDASGSFEADETIISSEALGTIKVFEVEEGQMITTGQSIGYVDSIQLYLKKKQLEEQIQSMLSKRPNISLQLAALETQLSTAESEKKRVENLLKGNAATPKSLDDVNAQIQVIKSQMAALNSTLTITSQGISNDANSLAVQIEQLNDQLAKCRIISPMNGTVLTTYAKANEMTSPGKPLYKVADLSEMILRVYISGNQLAKVKLNQTVKVVTDDGNGGSKEAKGTIVWINNKGEFTPKTIQTKDERANMVYAIKVKVKNDGTYKIGMYGEIIF